MSDRQGACKGSFWLSKFGGPRQPLASARLPSTPESLIQARPNVDWLARGSLFCGEAGVWTRSGDARVTSPDSLPSGPG